MPESIDQIQGNLSSKKEFPIDVVKNPELTDMSIDLARVAVDTSFGGEYVPNPETCEHTRIIDIVSRLHDTHRKSVARDASAQSKSGYDLAA